MLLEAACLWEHAWGRPAGRVNTAGGQKEGWCLFLWSAAACDCLAQASGSWYLTEYYRCSEMLFVAGLSGLDVAMDAMQRLSRGGLLYA